MTTPETRKIYILEDDRDVATVFARALRAEGFQVSPFGDIGSFARRLAEAAPQLCIVDIGLPDGDGLSVLRNSLARQGVPTIIVTGRGGLADKLKGLDEGADDYIVKPVEPLELVARVRTVLRRASGRDADRSHAAEAPAVAEFAGWRVDFTTFQLTSPERDTAVLSRSDARLLRAFLEAQGRVLTRDFLLDLCELGADENLDRAIDVRVSRLRKKLRDDSRSPTHIRTVYGAGYVFASPATWI
jgi:two-component system, OmpR family, response regulator